MTSFVFVDDAPLLARVAAQLAGEPELALDTEFMREETYYPRLCLVQIAHPSGDVYCIDPLALQDLSPLAALFADSAIRKVVHAARQDVEVLLTRTELPRNLFDTQVAAALCGMSPQIGYGELVHKVLDLQLEKAHSRTDWTRRPLSAEQLHYAADDVRHLLPLRQTLQARLENLGRLSWFAGEMERLADAGLYRTDPANAWQRLKGLDSDDARRMAVAQAIARWREERAINRNRPRGWILSDDAVYEIVRSLPADLQALGALRSIPAGVVQKCGAELVAAVAASAHLPVNPRRSTRYVPPTAEEQKKLKALIATVKTIADGLDLSPEILASRKDLQQLLNGRTDIHALKGWRREVVGEALLRQL